MVHDLLKANIHKSDTITKCESCGIINVGLFSQMKIEFRILSIVNVLYTEFCSRDCASFLFFSFCRLYNSDVYEAKAYAFVHPMSTKREIV